MIGFPYLGSMQTKPHKRIANTKETQTERESDCEIELELSTKE